MPTTIHRLSFEVNADEDDMINVAELIEALTNYKKEVVTIPDPEPVHKAAEKDDVIELWSYPISDLIKPDYNGRTPLHYAVRGGATRVLAYLYYQGISMNIKDNYNATPLHIAAQKGNTSIIGALLNYGADITNIDDDDDCPLHIAMYGKDDQLGAYELLLNHYKTKALTVYAVDECVICMGDEDDDSGNGNGSNGKSSIVFIPCGHCCICTKCNDIYDKNRCHHAKCYDEERNKCPICRERVIDTMLLTDD